MKIFLSYASEDREIAREVAATLRASGHRVFFDQTELSPAEEIHAKIARQLQLSDAIIFLLSPSMLEAGRYTLSEIELAERKWPNPMHRVFPVVVRPIDKNIVPGYLRAVPIMSPSGPIAASIVQTMQRLQHYRLGHRLIIAAIVTLSLAVFALLGAVLFWTKLPFGTASNMRPPDILRDRPPTPAPDIADFPKWLFDELDQAERYSRGDFDSKEKALQIYRNIVKKLPPNHWEKLDKQLLDQAEWDFKQNYTNDAVRKYGKLFHILQQVITGREKREP